MIMDLNYFIVNILERINFISSFLDQAPNFNFFNNYQTNFMFLSSNNNSKILFKIMFKSLLISIDSNYDPMKFYANSFQNVLPSPQPEQLTNNFQINYFDEKQGNEKNMLIQQENSSNSITNATALSENEVDLSVQFTVDNYFSF